MRRSTVIALWLGSVACRADPSPAPHAAQVVTTETAEPVALEVLVSGCGDLREGPTCVVLDPSAPLRLWAEIDPAFETSVWLDGTELEVEPVPAQGGQRWAILPTPGTHTIELRARLDDVDGHFALTLEPPEARPIALKAIDDIDDTDEAGRTLDTLLPQLRGQARAMGLMKAGELALGRGDLDAAIVALSRGHDAAMEQGCMFDASTMAQRLVYIHVELRFDLAEARRWLERDAEAMGQHPDQRTYHAYYAALVAQATGDLRTAVPLLREVERSARAMGSTRMEFASISGLLLLAERVGAFEDVERLHQRALVLAPTMPTLDRCYLFNQVAWSMLQARARGRATDNPVPLLTRSLREMGESEDTLTVELRRTVTLNLAYAAILDERTEDAERWLGRTTPDELVYEDRLWRSLMEARTALLAHDIDRAGARYRRLLEEADAGFEPELRWQAHLGLGQIEQTRGHLEAARRNYTAAELLLEAQLPRIAMGEGRERFVAERDRGARRLVDLLLRMDRHEDALCAARLARTRALRTLARQVQTPRHASPAVRDALRRNRQARSALERELDESWGLTEPEARKTQRRVARQRRTLQDEVDRLFAKLDPGAATMPTCDDLPPPAAGTLDLHYMPLDDGWVGFAVDAQGIIVRRLGPLELPLPTTETERAAWGRALLDPFAEAITHATKLRVMATGSLSGVPFHALPSPADPSALLVELMPVTQGLDLPRPAVEPPRSPAATNRALMIVPPSNLVHAEAEADDVTRRLNDAGWSVERLGADAATGKAVRAALPTAALAHYVGHAHSDGISGWDSALDLARDGTLAVQDVLALPGVPHTVVLNGCETGLTDPRALAGGMSLAHAFVVAGSSMVVATDETVDDAAAARLTTAFYRHLTASDDVPGAVALQHAQADLRGPEQAWLHTRAWTP